MTPRLQILLRTVTLLCLLLGAGLASAQNFSLFPRPPEIEPAIKFWTRVYTEVDTDSGFLHDANNLAVVYQRIDYDRPEIEQHRTRIQNALKTLGTGKRTGLSSFEQELLELWPANVSNDTLVTAANNVRFQLGQSDRFVEGLIRSGAYRDHINNVVSAKGLPLELGALPHVESSFHPGAYSSVAAAGMWQFMRTTGQRFMRIDHIVDERMDPYKATYAAMSLLEHNYSVLGTWPLALTAYNHGTGGMSRAARETGSKRIEDIIANYKGPSFGFASRNFYPQFLAVLDVERQAQTLFGVLQLDPHPQYDEYELDAYIEAQTLADVLGVTLEHLKFDNPALRPVVWEGGKRIPAGYVVKVQRRSLRAPLATLISQIPSADLHPIQTPDLAYVVQGGDSLSAIARRFNTSVAALTSLNQLANSHRIAIGQRLLLPQDSAAATGQSSAQIAATALNQAGNGVAQTARLEGGTYTVRQGDTLSSIAGRLDVTELALLQTNQIDHPDRIYPGQALRLPSNEALTAQPVVYVTFEPQETAPAPEPATVVENTAAAPQSEAVALEVAAHSEADIAQALVDLAADPSDYSVGANSSIEIQASETLGHYADWLDLSSADLRNLNRMSTRQPVVMGERLRLDFSKVSPEQFELRRRQFHLQQQREFFRQYRIQNVDQYQVAANDNIANLARQKYSVPMWLLRQYNPQLNFRQVQIGQTVVFPLLEPVQVQGSSG